MAHLQKVLRVQSDGVERTLKQKAVRAFEFGMVRRSAQEISDHLLQADDAVGIQVSAVDGHRLDVGEWSVAARE